MRVAVYPANHSKKEVPMSPKGLLASVLFVFTAISGLAMGCSDPAAVAEPDPDPKVDPQDLASVLGFWN